MKTIGAVLVGIMLLGLAGCSDSIVGTDAELSSPSFKKGGGGGPPGGGDPSEWPMTVTFRDDPGDQIRSDKELRSDLTDFSYSDGECGVMARIGNLDDARFDPDWSYKRKDAGNCGGARLLVFEFDDGRPDNHSGAFVNVNGLCAMAIGEVRDTTYGQFNVGLPLAFEDLRAQRVDAVTWVVSTDGGSGDLATKGDGSTHTMPFGLTITAGGSNPCPVG
jgi:hypothetical protein